MSDILKGLVSLLFRLVITGFVVLLGALLLLLGLVVWGGRADLVLGDGSQAGRHLPDGPARNHGLHA